MCIHINICHRERRASFFSRLLVRVVVQGKLGIYEDLGYFHCKSRSTVEGYRLIRTADSSLSRVLCTNSGCFYKSAKSGYNLQIVRSRVHALPPVFVQTIQPAGMIWSAEIQSVPYLCRHTIRWCWFRTNRELNALNGTIICDIHPDDLGRQPLGLCMDSGFRCPKWNSASIRFGY